MILKASDINVFHTTGLGSGVVHRPGNWASIFSEKFLKIFPNIYMMIATLVALGLVILILFFLAYKPIKKIVKERQNYIQNNIDQSKETYDLSKQKLAEANGRLLDAHKEADNIINSAKKQAEKVSLTYTENAKKESQRILDEAQLNINQQRQNLLEESKNKIAKAASEMSRKILQKEISKKTEEEIIDQFLNDDSQ